LTHFHVIGSRREGCRPFSDDLRTRTGGSSCSSRTWRASAGRLVHRSVTGTEPRNKDVRLKNLAEILFLLAQHDGLGAWDNSPGSLWRVPCEFGSSLALLGGVVGRRAVTLDRVCRRELRPPPRVAHRLVNLRHAPELSGSVLGRPIHPRSGVFSPAVFCDLPKEASDA
jgi:hypothetical protein